MTEQLRPVDGRQTRTRNYTVGSGFPIAPRETITIRDGQGRAVERWTAVEIREHKTSKDVTFSQVGYRDVGHL